MKLTKMTIVLCAVAICCATTVNASDLKYSTLFIRTTKGYGSGFPVERFGNRVRILTAEHVVQGISTVDVYCFTPSSYPRPHRRYNGQVVSSGPNDVAVIEIETSDKLNLLPIARHGPKVGDTVYYAGCTGGRSPTSHTAQISRIKSTMYITNVAPAKGQSGGPLVNASGEVIGVTNVQYCIPTFYCYAGGFAILKDLQLALHRERQHSQPQQKPREQYNYLTKRRPSHSYSRVTISGNTVTVHGTGVTVRSSGSVIIIQH